MRPLRKANPMRKPTIPTFETQTRGAYAKDTRNGALYAFAGALVAGLALGTLGPAGVTVALLGIMLTVSGLGMMFGPRPLDSTLYRAAVALPFGFACPILKVDAKVAPLKVGQAASANKTAFRGAMKAAQALIDGKATLAKCQPAFKRAERASGALILARARWLGDWPKTA